MKEISLFLEYKFGDFKDKELSESGANEVMAWIGKMNVERRRQLKQLGFKVGMSIDAMPGGEVCPASKEAREHLLTRVREAIGWKSDTIWLDHFRFEGHWESAVNFIPGAHPQCQYCKGKDRVGIIADLMDVAKKVIPRGIRTGYFAVPFKKEDFGGWAKILGQDHQKLGQIFDYISPMLYHRMIDKPVEYIGDYINYLASLNIKAKILPIVQLKDMPDELEDKLSLGEIGEEVRLALTPPSIGVAVFSWDQTIEKEKLEGVSKILSLIKK